MKLITEEIRDVKVLVEEKDGQKSVFITGPFLQAEVVNRNKRKYSADIMEREANRYIQEKIQAGMAYGELGHPNGPNINLERVSHMTKELRREGNDWIGKAKLTNTPYGNIAMNLLQDGANLGVSSRGMGSLKKAEGFDMVMDDFRLAVAADIVADPSAPNAFVRGVMEGSEWTWDEANGEWIRERIDDLQRKLRTKTAREIEEKALKVFEGFLETLKNAPVDLQEISKDMARHYAVASAARQSDLNNRSIILGNDKDGYTKHAKKLAAIDKEFEKRHVGLQRANKRLGKGARVEPKF